MATYVSRLLSNLTTYRSDLARGPAQSIRLASEPSTPRPSLLTVAISPDTETTPRVSHLARSIQRALRVVGSGWVEGEVQRLRRPSSGHIYFSLADEDATIECCVWRSRAERIEQWPSEGALVQVHFEKADFYARQGRVSLHVDALRMTGEGELLARKEATLARLRADGFVERPRRPLPAFPSRVGVIAARDSDAKADVIEALRERWPSVHIVHRAALVEGVRAVDSVIDALAHLQDIPGVDVIVIARGGGGVRDLVAFDDERLCRAIFASVVPVVTSIGHTPQRPNCDLVAAAYADVPARTAELVVPSEAELMVVLNRALVALGHVPAQVRSQREQLTATWERARPRRTLARWDLELNTFDGRLHQTAVRFYSERWRMLHDSRHRLSRARCAVPAPSALDLADQQLHTAAKRFFADRENHLEAMGRGLTVTRGRYRAPDDVGQLVDRLMPAAARGRRRAEDFGRAFARLREQADRTLARRLRDHDRNLVGAARDLATTTHRRGADVGRTLDHIVELIAARDFRLSGWVLAGDTAGRPIRSALDLTAGDALSLHFHDGHAAAAVTTVDL